MPARNLLLLALAAGVLGAAPSKGKEAAHPAVGPDAVESCESCHADVTAPVVQEWQASDHGLTMVKCFVCHGSTGKDFTVRPAAQRCDGCHAAQVASVTPARGAPRACFDCHAPHALSAEGKPNPHAP